MSKVHECKVEHLRPTQITVGMIEVEDKLEHIRKLSEKQVKDFLHERPIPAVFGPEGKLYLTDHHHLGRALADAGIEHGFFLVEADFSLLAHDRFWTTMHANAWVHPIDEHGKHCSVGAIPHHLEELRDDPYRSLAGYVRDAGGYEKTPTAFAEFAWADFFRPRVKIGWTRAEFCEAVKQGLALAGSPLASKLPGYKPACEGVTHRLLTPVGGE
jgi:hypothetical protein